MKMTKTMKFALTGFLILIIAAISVYAYNTGVLAGDPTISEEEAKQKREAEEKAKRERIRLENERLKKDAEKREAEIAKERAKAEAERKERGAKERAEREAHEAALAKERAERERIEAELKAKAEAERKEREEKERLDKYRQLLKVALLDKELSRSELLVLKMKRKSLGLSDREARRVEQELGLKLPS